MKEFFLKQLYNNLTSFTSRVAFHIEGVSYTYAQLAIRIAAIQQQILSKEAQQFFGVVTRNSIDTYAGIFACWLSGKTAVPIGVRNPQERNQFIIDQVEINTVFDAGIEPMSFNNLSSLNTLKFSDHVKQPVLMETSGETDLYILFTSGSTGVPKGVRITHSNFDAYLRAFFSCGYQFSPDDRCSQVYELTFDASVQCYTFPLLVGASVYTVPQGGVKYLEILKILKNEQITFTKMPPSVIYYLNRYFDQICLPHIRYCLFGAEAFPTALVMKWEKCVPNAEIHNVYGPTEATINCTWYPWKKGGSNKSRNGIAAIGREYENMIAIICDESLNIVPNGTAGELCLSGPQITPGYWKSPENNRKAFFQLTLEGKKLRFYRTGDIAIKDNDGDIQFVGRIDSQVQIDGHRIELGEIEYHAAHFSNLKCIALVTGSDELSHGIILFVESLSINSDFLMTYLRDHLPTYMLPLKIVPVQEIPLLSSGKTDRKELLKMI